jgi:signal transduction histidine kinase
MPEAPKIFNVLKDNIQRIDHIIKSFLTFGRQEKPTKEWIDVQTVLKNTLELATNLRQFDQIEICTEFAADVPAILGDQHRLTQVFVNLLNNARDAMAERGGRLTISYERDGNELRIKFKDTGKGISAQDLKNIFTPFFTTKEPGKGTGLGLSISYGIIQEHGGSLDVESREGMGTTFTIRLVIPTISSDHEKSKT